MKETKQKSYARYFGSNRNNAKNTWKGTKTIISTKNTESAVSHLIGFSKKTIADCRAMSNIFNNFFCLQNQTSNLHPNITQTAYLKQIKVLFS